MRCTRGAGTGPNSDRDSALATSESSTERPANLAPKATTAPSRVGLSTTSIASNLPLVVLWSRSEERGADQHHGAQVLEAAEIGESVGCGKTHSGCKHHDAGTERHAASLSADCVSPIPRRTAKASRMELDQKFAFVWTVRKGLLTHVRVFTDRDEALKAAGLSE